MLLSLFFFFFFNDTATTEIYTLSLHDALPISDLGEAGCLGCRSRKHSDHDRRIQLWGVDDQRDRTAAGEAACRCRGDRDRKSTRLNSSHLVISYAVFCLKKKKSNSDSTMPHQR